MDHKITRVVAFFLFIGSICCGQQKPIVPIATAEKVKIELVSSNSLEFDNTTGINAQRLIGNVQFKHQGILMFCDSAYFFDKENRLEAFSNVHILQGDTLNLYGDHLDYYGDTRIAALQKNIKLTDREMILTTNLMNYDLNTNIASYFNHGKIISTKNKNVLDSNKGYYFANTEILNFKDSVVLVNPQYTIYTDTLQYNTIPEIAYFFGPTKIIAKKNMIYCENGWYDTKNDLSQFKRNAYVISNQNKLRGDSITYNRVLGVGEVFKNVIITDTINDFLIRGEYAKHLEKGDKSFVTGNAVLVQIENKDSLFLHGDTLYSYTDTLQRNVLMAYHKVKFFKTDLQGSCDSLSWTKVDSTLRMFVKPILWSGQNQITGDSISIKSKAEGIDKLYIVNSAFIASEADTGQYNQIKGKNMTGIFVNNKLQKIYVNGNGQTVYFAKEEKEGNSADVGLNKADCSNIVVDIKDNKITRITFLTSPTGAMIPAQDIKEEDKLLKGFQWYKYKRPMDKWGIFD
jgi:lipopolysaccharide export system protein LptA